MTAARRIAGLALVGAGVIAVAFFTLVLLRGMVASRQPELRAWHRALRSEIRARDLTDRATLADYLRREEAVFAELSETVAKWAPAAADPPGRYAPGSPLDPLRFSKNWNRTFELPPRGRLRGGVLLVHGLTDSPYSVRALAEAYREEGFYALGLRMPGHGTVPGALLEARREDWRAAVRLGARHVRSRAGALPFHLLGYSNGGALAVEYALDALEDPRLPRADRLVLVSPMIGVAPFAAFAFVARAAGAIPAFEKSRWLEISPEINPFKYGSFPVVAAQQTAALTASIQESLRRAAERGANRALPPILAFSSLADATVETAATVERLYGRLPRNGSALVLFDVHRAAEASRFLRPGAVPDAAALFADPARRYRLTLLTDAAPDSDRVAARDAAPESVRVTETALSLSWPAQVFSLSHVALPFPMDDPLYGLDPDRSADYGIRLGRLSPRGERGVLTVPFDQWMRINCNPFFPYLVQRVKEWIGRN